MGAVATILGDVKESLSKPLREDMPLSQILLVFVLFFIVAYIVYDMLTILKQWAAQAV